MVIAFDARYSVGPYRGMGHFARQLMKHSPMPFLSLLSKGQSDDIERCSSTAAGPAEAATSLAVARGLGIYPLWEQRTLPEICANHDVDILVCPYNTAPIRLRSETTLVLVVHDLIFMEPFSRLKPSASIYQNLGRLYRRLIVPRAVQRADVLVTCSEYSRQRISVMFGVAKNRILVLPSASAARPTTVKSGVQLPSRVAGLPFVLFVGGDAPSKNAENAIRAFELFCQRSQATDHCLVVLGVPEKRRERLRSIIASKPASKRVVFLDYVEHLTLRKLYQEASVVFFPSLYEGFGIPALDAMAAGTPVVCSDRTSLPEIVGQAGRLVDPESISDMADALEDVLMDRRLGERMRDQGLIECRRYSPGKIELAAEAVWQEAVSRHRERNGIGVRHYDEAHPRTYATISVPSHRRRQASHSRDL